MKLTKRFNRTYLRLSACVLSAGVAFIYLFVGQLIREEQDDALLKEFERIRAHLRLYETLPHLPPVLETETLTGPAAPCLRLSDTLLFDPVEGEVEAFRQLLAVTELDGRRYAVRLRAARLEAHDLLPAVGLPAAGLLLLLIGGLFWLSRTAMLRCWRPFYDTLGALKNFSIAQPDALQLKPGEIDEFNQLNRTVLQLADKTRADYRNLKEFTENASHEIQTPLAIIRSKTEWLMQSGKWAPEQAAAVAAVYQAANRLSKLNQGLILLSRIENQQFVASGLVSLQAVVREQAALLEELTAANNFRLDVDMPDEMQVRMHPVLAELLVKNLLENALRYSPPGSVVSVRSAAACLAFSNPGAQALDGGGSLFRRFARRSTPADSPGLGLAIAHKICEVSGLRLGYDFTAGQHRFTVTIPD